MKLWNVEHMGLLNILLMWVGCFYVGYKIGYFLGYLTDKIKRWWNEVDINCNSSNFISKILCTAYIYNVLVRVSRLAKRKTQTD